ncbi:MAG: AI-2E family transporter [Candidatus Moraniibacteriota bacterium]
MQLKSFNVYFFFALLIGVSVLVFFIFKPFLTAIIVAAILATFMKRPYHFFEKLFRGHRSVSALLTCLMAIVIVVTPVAVVATLVLGEVDNLYESIETQGSIENMLNKAYETVADKPLLKQIIRRDSFSEEKFLNDIQQLSSNALGIFQKLYQSISSFVLWVFILFFTLYYFLIDGKRILRSLMEISPLKNEHDRLLVEKFVSISRATLKGNLVVGVIQGFLGGLAFAIAGIPGAVIWGVIMAFFSLIPMVGTGIIWLPAAIILLLLGEAWQGIFMLVFGTFVISSIDNILRPKLVGRDSAMHPLMVFFATIGGIYLFGLPGFVMGPIVVSLFLALGQIYQIEFRSQLKEYNQPEEV